MAHPVTSALVARLTSDFGALQDAALAHAFGTAAPETAAALTSPDLADAHAGALLHAETLARGDLHRARLGRAVERERRALGLRLRRISQARKRAVTVAWQLRRESGTPPRARLPLAARVLHTARPDAFGAALDAVCAERGLTVDALCPPSSHVWEWACGHGLVTSDVLLEAERLLTCSAEEFVQALLHDAREEENPLLPHGAVVERWARHARTARAWGRYAVALAERTALERPPTARVPRLDALEAAYQDAAVLALRAHEAVWRLADLRRRIGHLAAPITGELRLECGREAALRLAAAEPVLWQKITTAAVAHRLSCRHSDDDCPSCHRLLAASFLPGPEDSDGSGNGEEAPHTEPAAPALDAARYALLGDVPADTPWAVADAAIDAEDSALCGYGWAAADGSADWGDSMASGSGEAEAVAICQAALALLDRYPRQRVLVLCDSAQAVDAVRSALDSGDTSTAHRTALFPEARALLDRLLAHRGRVEIRWLKGHIGHDLNETADALARLALRRADGRTPAPAAHREATRLLRSLEPCALPVAA